MLQGPTMTGGVHSVEGPTMTGGVHSVAGQVVFIVLQDSHSVTGSNHDRWCS